MSALKLCIAGFASLGVHGAVLMYGGATNIMQGAAQVQAAAASQQSGDIVLSLGQMRPTVVSALPPVGAAVAAAQVMPGQLASLAAQDVTPKQATTPKKSKASSKPKPQKASASAASRKGAQGSASASASQQSSAYPKQVRAHLARFKRYPSRLQALQARGTSVVAFKIDPNGRITHLQLLKSSGWAGLDAEALATVKRAQPMPKPKAGSAKVRMEIVFQP